MPVVAVLTMHHRAGIAAARGDQSVGQLVRELLRL